MRGGSIARLDAAARQAAERGQGLTPEELSADFHSTLIAIQGNDMSEIPRLNGVIGALERGQVAFSAFSPLEYGCGTRLQHRQI